ncbi:hypothetical protein J1614_003802 [Plenodomus biglobosus]|nr:hypothetical protein J1614_003802 [Plenodomus biglobosus]
MVPTPQICDCNCQNFLDTLTSHLAPAIPTLYRSAAIAILLVLLTTLDLHIYVLQVVFYTALFALYIVIHALLVLLAVISVWEDARTAAGGSERHYGDSPVRVLLDGAVRSGVGEKRGVMRLEERG